MLPYQIMLEAAWEARDATAEVVARRQFVKDVEALPELLRRYKEAARTGANPSSDLCETIIALAQPAMLKPIKAATGFDIRDDAAVLAERARARMRTLREEFGEESEPFLDAMPDFSRWCKKLYAKDTTPYERRCALEYIEKNEENFMRMFYSDERPRSSLCHLYFCFFTNLPTSGLDDAELHSSVDGFFDGESPLLEDELSGRAPATMSEEMTL